MKDEERSHECEEEAPVAPWHSVPVYEGRDLARADLWELSLALARSKREIARNPLLLPKARRFSVSIVAAAIVTAAPSVSLAHSRASGGASAATRAREGAHLALGNTGALVRKLQRALGLNADGIFGPRTLRAVRSFQKQHSLTVDGIVGPATWTALTEAHAGGRAAGAGSLLELGDRGTAVTRLQRALGIAADGIFGRQTLKAVRAFQRAHGLAVDGIAGPATRAELAGQVAARNGATLERGDTGPAVTSLQRALGIATDGVFGHQTLAAVRAFQAQNDLTVDGIVGPATHAALANGDGDVAGSGGGEHSHEQAASTSSVRSDVDARLGEALALAERMGLQVISAYRPGATIAASGNRSDHSYMPSKAIDLGGSQEALTQYARSVAGMAGVETVIYSPIGMWLSGSGWGSIHSSATYQEHLNHVHVDTF